MAKKEPVTFVTKLGTAKGRERARIWIEGKRLVEAGFVVGRHFVKEWGTAFDRIGPNTGPALSLTLLADDDVVATAPCTVSGKGEKPIIDITGEKVAGVFGNEFTHVQVRYHGDGNIVIVGSREHRVQR